MNTESTQFCHGHVPEVSVFVSVCVHARDKSSDHGLGNGHGHGCFGQHNPGYGQGTNTDTYLDAQAKITLAPLTASDRKHLFHAPPGYLLRYSYDSLLGRWLSLHEALEGLR